MCRTCSRFLCRTTARHTKKEGGEEKLACARVSLKSRARRQQPGALGGSETQRPTHVRIIVNLLPDLPHHLPPLIHVIERHPQVACHVVEERVNLIDDPACHLVMQSEGARHSIQSKALSKARRVDRVPALLELSKAGGSKAGGGGGSVEQCDLRHCPSSSASAPSSFQGPRSRPSGASSLGASWPSSQQVEPSPPQPKCRIAHQYKKERCESLDPVPQQTEFRLQTHTHQTERVEAGGGRQHSMMSRTGAWPTMPASRSTSIYLGLALDDFKLRLALEAGHHADFDNAHSRLPMLAGARLLACLYEVGL